ncbi:cytochrome c3 family protein [Anaeromyxobacter sp. Red801]|uniref:cytochrome c3 family protein n=1 Tax=Anaeromyxobacter sp. Red801 TaxID=3411632 RepID=UPI003BA2D6FE
MPVAPLAAFLALALAATPQPPPESARVASVPEAAGGVVITALPPPPSTVVRTTKTYGTVTLDHAAHLARKISCKSCHGNGAVTKIEFTPRLAHDTCRSCHVQLAKGPTDCRGCHVVAPPKEAPVVAEAAPKPPAGAVIRAGEARPLMSAAPSAGGVTGGVARGAAAVPSLPHGAAGEVEPGPALAPFVRTLEAGLSVLGGSGQDLVAGPSVRLTSHYDRALLTHSLDWVGGRDQGRVLFMVGGGAELPVHERVALQLVGIGGVDAAGSTVVLMPALGARVGLAWRRAVPWLDTLTFSFAGVSDLVRRRDDLGEREGGVMFAFSVTSGYRLEQFAR